MSDNPFAEPDDDNRTIIRPNPGRRRQQPADAGGDTQVSRPSQPAPAAPPAQQRAVAVAEGTEKISGGDDVLTADSPLGRALVGRSAGDTVTYAGPDGDLPPQVDAFSGVARKP